MNNILYIAIAGWLLINLFQGTLGLILFQTAIAFTIPFCIRLIGHIGNHREKRAACNLLEEDIHLLKRCHRQTVDPDLCRNVGADAAIIRQTLRQASTLITMLESYEGQPDRHIEALFGGTAPSRSQCAAVISELRHRRGQLTAWLGDEARRDILIATGEYLTPAEVGDQIKSRAAAISAIRSDGSGWVDLDNMVGPIAGILTFFMFEVGLVCTALYVVARIIIALSASSIFDHHPPLEPTSDKRSEYAKQSAQRLTDLNSILLGHSAQQSPAGNRIGNGPHTRHR